MTLRLHIQKENLQRLAALAALSKPAFEEFLKFFENRANTFGDLSAVQDAAEGLTLCAADAAQIVQAIFPLLVKYIADGKTAEEVTAAAVAGVRRNEDRQLLKSAKELKVLRDRLIAIFSSSEATLKAKALLLVAQRPTILRHVRIVSDIRPIFGSGKAGADKVDACTVIHTLVLTCIQDGEQVEHHIALDEGDLTSLKDAVERARAKNGALLKLLDRAKVAKVEIR